ncbi:hypothetical protein GLOTRDRAFT_126268 [Gloeophyllum trabeum ATCC 11539]|uniref:Mitochondrial distribution and morphology protein 12 n=1 Tax=Gloeophyllum trabeum (strain ATCC 11539 / FP-39264 / Madison 617) TaxID=670483 RepID=S7QED6_GLOTA|nr:uncharacterized protein GLOTRDRAFT_126268 [Gloeophyllum trabeum ATCC 11539]EPQ57777.1 hypothetical protein GLOTRDRAFT_126268 [Gloeophyllum trabeum ATCC 11539]
MSIDLLWDKLDGSLASSLVDLLNRQLANTSRPSFIGPVEVTSFDFGSASPDVTLVDLRDIYRDFLEDDDEEADRDVVDKVTQGPAVDSDDEFEWVSRKAVRKGLADEVPAYHHLPPHVRYGRGPSMDLFASTPGLYSPTRDIWAVGGGASPMAMSFSGLADLRPAFGGRTPLSAAGSTAAFSPPQRDPRTPPNTAAPLPEESDEEQESQEPSEQPPPANPHPNLQLHLHITWQSNLRLTLTTSLLINYPSPMFMSLPIKLSVTGLLFDGEVAVAYEGERRRVHLCILDDQDPYGPACDRSKRDSVNSTPPTPDDDSPGSMSGPRLTKPLPIGQRLLPSILIESEIGEADKHVLKNVSRVERFIQDIIRKTVEEELVFPNFHTLIMGE